MIDWTHWHNEPFLIGGLIFLGWFYAILTGPLRSWINGRQYPAADRQSPNSLPLAESPVVSSYPRKEAIRFYSALLIFYLAVGSPLDQAGERFLLSAHMLQHQLMIYPAAILFLLGLPNWLVRPITAQPSLRLLLRLLTQPIICGLVFSVVLSCWHFPSLYDWALQDRTVHLVEHFMMFGAALFLWWPICSPSREFPPMKYAWQMFYYVAITIAMTPVFAYITFSQDILYPTYEFAPRICWLSPADDQLLAGSMMKLGGLTMMMGGFAVGFYRWYRTSESGK